MILNHSFLSCDVNVADVLISVMEPRRLEIITEAELSLHDVMSGTRVECESGEEEIVYLKTHSLF